MAWQFDYTLLKHNNLSGREQMAVVLRYVDSDYTINEDLIGMHQADKVDAASFVEIIR